VQPLVEVAKNREPVIVHAAQLTEAKQKLAVFAKRTGRRPNVLVFIMDDVGWGDLGAYGGRGRSRCADAPPGPAGADDKVPTDRYIDSIDQTSYLLADAGASNRKFVYYWLCSQFSGIRFGEYKYMTLISGEVPTDYIEGGFGGSATNLAYGALYNLWLDPKETRNFLIRKLPYISIYEQGIARHLATFRVYPPKCVVEMPTR
jgi:hypothetical protein